MTEHGEIRGWLGLAAAGALNPDEEERVRGHLQACATCAAEFEDWQLLTGRFRRLPTPQPSPGILERSRARAESRLAEEAEYRWHRGVLIFLAFFSWTLTVLIWPVVHFLTGGLLGVIDPRLSQSWLGFAAYATLAWLAAGMAAVLLARQQRQERRAV